MCRFFTGVGREWQKAIRATREDVSRGGLRGRWTDVHADVVSLSDVYFVLVERPPAAVTVVQEGSWRL